MGTAIMMSEPGLAKAGAGNWGLWNSSIHDREGSEGASREEVLAFLRVLTNLPLANDVNENVRRIFNNYFNSVDTDNDEKISRQGKKISISEIYFH